VWHIPILSMFLPLVRIEIALNCGLKVHNPDLSYPDQISMLL
jgi:hypothetical protein